MLSTQVWKATSAPSWAMGQNVHSSWPTQAMLNQWTGPDLSGREVAVHYGGTLPSAVQKKQNPKKQTPPHRDFFWIKDVAERSYFSSDKNIFFVWICFIHRALISALESTSKIFYFLELFYEMERWSNVHEIKFSYFSKIDNKIQVCFISVPLINLFLRKRR